MPFSLLCIHTHGDELTVYFQECFCPRVLQRNHQSPEKQRNSWQLSTRSTALADEARRVIQKFHQSIFFHTPFSQLAPKRRSLDTSGWYARRSAQGVYTQSTRNFAVGKRTLWHGLIKLPNATVVAKSVSCAVGNGRCAHLLGLLNDASLSSPLRDVSS